MQSGGYLRGPSHSRGGIPIEAEGGEYIIKKESVTPQTKPILESINRSGGTMKRQYKHGGYISPRKYAGGGYVPIDYEKPFTMKTNMNNYMTVDDMSTNTGNEKFDKFYSSYSDNVVTQEGADPMLARRLKQDRRGTEGEYYSDLGAYRIGQPTEYGFSNNDTFDLIEGSDKYSSMPRPSKKVTPLSKNVFTGEGFTYHPPVKPVTAERLSKLKAFERKEGESSVDMFNRMEDEGITTQRYTKNDSGMNVMGESQNYKEGQ